MNGAPTAFTPDPLQSLTFAACIQHLPSVCPDGWPFFVQPSIVTSGTPLREDTFVHLHHSASGEARLSHLFQKEKNSGSSIQALHCFASFWPPKTWCFPFSERYCSCHSSCSVAKMCLTLQPRGLQQARLLRPPLCPRVCPNSCPFSRWCYLIISSSAAPFSFSLQSSLYKDFFPVSQLLSQVAKVLELQLQHQVTIKVINFTDKIRLDNTLVLLL